MVGVDEDVIDALIELQFDGDLDADGAGEHGESVAHTIVEVDDTGLENLAAAEGEQLTGDLGGALALLHDVGSLDSMAGSSCFCSSASSHERLIDWVMLLKSWATPPASRPTTSRR